jgi:hypothetical protein
MNSTGNCLFQFSTIQFADVHAITSSSDFASASNWIAPFGKCEINKDELNPLPFCEAKPLTNNEETIHASDPRVQILIIFGLFGKAGESIQPA